MVSTNPNGKPALYMMHPLFRKQKIPAVRLLGLGLTPALPVSTLKLGDTVLLDYGKAYRLKKFTDSPAGIRFPDGRKRMHLVASNGAIESRIVSSNTRVAVSWNTFNKRWTGDKTMKKFTEKKIKLAGTLNMNKSIDSGLNINDSIESGVNVNRKINLTPGKKINLEKY